MIPDRRSFFLTILPFLFCGSLVLALYYPVFLKGHWAVKACDALNLHLPNNQFIAQSFLKKQFPLWNPYFNLGQPVIDGTSRVFHPALILYMIFSPWAANTIEVISGLFLTFLGAWYLLRRSGAGIFPAIIGTLVYGLAGPVFSYHPYHMAFPAIMAFPWCLLIFHHYDRTGRVKWLWMAAAICVSVTHSLDYDTLLYFYAGLVIDRLACIPARRKINYAITWLPIFLLSLATGIVSYLPLYEWIENSSRIAKSYAGVLTPDIRNIFTAMFANRWQENIPYDVFYFYLGPAVLWLALSGLKTFDWADYRFRYFSYSLAIPLFYLGKRLFEAYLPGAPFIASLDFWRSMFIFCLGMAMVAGIGTGNILSGGRFQRRLSVAAGCLSIILSVWLTYSTGSAKGYVFLFIGGLFMLGTVFWSGALQVIARAIGISFTVMALLLAPAIERAVYKKDWRLWMLSVHPAFIQRDGFIKDLAYYSALAKTADGRDGHWRVSLLSGTENMTSLAGLMTIPNYTSIYNRNMEESFISDGLIKQCSIQPYWMRFDSADADVLAGYGVRFLVGLSWRNMAKEGAWIRRHDLSWPNHRVWENAHYIGRTYFTGPSGQARGGVEFLQDDPTAVVLRAEAQYDGEQLVLADLNYPGWQAFIDGKPVSAQAYHGCLRAVSLPKGVHIVRWEYTGRLQKIGLVLSAVAALLLVCFLAMLAYLQKNKRGR